MGLMAPNRDTDQRNDGYSETLILTQRPPNPILTSLHCVFDSSEHKTMQLNMAYMEEMFGFAIQVEDAILHDVEGFLSYLGQKVGEELACLSCDISCENVSAVQEHMKEAAHRQITAEDGPLLEEYSRFFRPQYTGTVGKETKIVTSTGSEVSASSRVTNAVRKSLKWKCLETEDSVLVERLGKDRRGVVCDKESDVIGEKASAIVQKQAKAVARKQATNMIRRHAVGIGGRAAIGVVGGPAVAAIGGTVLTVMTAKALIDAGGKAIDAVKEARATNEESVTEEPTIAQA